MGMYSLAWSTLQFRLLPQVSWEIAQWRQRLHRGVRPSEQVQISVRPPNTSSC
jgi:hypothetical protein